MDPVVLLVIIECFIILGTAVLLAWSIVTGGKKVADAITERGRREASAVPEEPQELPAYDDRGEVPPLP